MSVLAGKELRIVGFLCNWCSYGGADTAGTARAVQPTDLRIIRVPCSGRVNPLFVLKALINGADGVLVSGCHPRDCHYSAGNYYARRRLELLKEFLPVIGINPDRFEYTWVSASEGQRWKDVVTNFTNRIHALGPAPRWEDVPARYDRPEELIESIRPLGCGEHPALPELKQAIKDALAEGLEGVLGWKNGFDAVHAEPVLMTTPEEVDSLIWGPFNVHNLAVYLPKYKGRKIGVVVKGCDSKGVVELLAENLISREEVKIFGMGCNGTVSLPRILAKLPEGAKIESCVGRGNKLTITAGGQEYEMTMAEVAQDKCRLCTKPNAVVSDVFVGNPTTEPEAPADGRLPGLRFLDALSLEERMGYWKGQMERCIACHACRGACPMCVCRDHCVSDTRDPAWVTQEDTVQQKLFFQLIHAQHLAGRCTGCTECERACPMDIPVFALKQQFGRMIQKIFSYGAGLDVNATPPLLTYQVEEPTIKEHDLA
ncbi:hydrogenase iron-sulfur subunit [uncultured Mailhella sp.]|uniref:hydrogenase iron-sulfur subunit n=1 Tax=uncultured Mailhella sp. TaxID=1981031 RepID=UPI0025ECD6D6|nr:hydrogenase iron-sulfur subunit [uncultured Mailhella sp.]